MKSQLHDTIRKIKIVKSADSHSAMFTLKNRSLIDRVKIDEETNFISSVKILHFQMTYDLMEIVFFHPSLLLKISIVIDLQ
jgi:hypothetical protein